MTEEQLKNLIRRARLQARLCTGAEHFDVRQVAEFLRAAHTFEKELDNLIKHS